MSRRQLNFTSASLSENWNVGLVSLLGCVGWAVIVGGGGGRESSTYVNPLEHDDVASVESVAVA